MTAEKKPLKNLEISVIVPVYKVEKYLNECIDSILAQTFTDFEVILVDDGSPDGCPALCDAAAEKDSRVRVIHKANGGVSTARNAGLAAARGNWVGFVDSDDVIDKTYLEKLYCAAKQSGAEIAACNMLFMQEDGIPCRYQERPLRTEVLSQDEAIHRMRLTPLIQATTRLHRRDILEGWSSLLERTMKMPLLHRKFLNVQLRLPVLRKSCTIIGCNQQVLCMERQT